MQLDAIHDHLNSNAMDRITWIVIWLIVVACLVELVRPFCPLLCLVKETRIDVCLNRVKS
jgi:uncharacterized Rmd1/YagE family protein